MSRRTETAYKAQFPGKSATHDKAPDSGDRVNARLCGDSSRPYTPQGGTELSPGRSGRHAVIMTASCVATHGVTGQLPSPFGLWQAREVSSLSGRSSRERRPRS
ncbi:hypothetical protein ACFL0M_02975 [Thermodesulfobacteriota bacterium]